MIYFCFRCNSSFTRKDNLKTHLNKKKVCDAVVLKISRYECYNSYDKYHNTFMETKYGKKIIEYKCKYCDKRFEYKNSLYRHEKKYCKQYELITLKEELERKMHLEFNELKQIMMNSNSINGNNNNMTNNSHNTYNSTNIENQIVNNNFYLNPFGKENYTNVKKFTEDELIELCDKYQDNNELCYKLIGSIIYRLHLDVEENQNVYFNIREKGEIYFFGNKFWVCSKNIQGVIREIITIYMYELHEMFINDNNRLGNIKNKKIAERINGCIELLKLDKEQKYNIFIGGILHKNSQKIKDNYEKNSGLPLHYYSVREEKIETEEDIKAKEALEIAIKEQNQHLELQKGRIDLNKKIMQKDLEYKQENKNLPCKDKDGYYLPYPSITKK